MRLVDLNGWQRLWLVGTGLALISFGLIYPLMLTGQSDIGQWDYRRPLERDEFALNRFGILESALF